MNCEIENREEILLFFSCLSFLRFCVVVIDWRWEGKGERHQLQRNDLAYKNTAIHKMAYPSECINILYWSAFEIFLMSSRFVQYVTRFFKLGQIFIYYPIKK